MNLDHPHPVTEFLSSCKTETLYPLNNNSPFLAPGSWWQPSLYFPSPWIDYSRYFILVESYTICHLWLAYFISTMSSRSTCVIACVKIFFLFQAEYNSIGWICYQKVRFLGLAACHPKAIKQARLVEGKVCFISDVSTSHRGGGGQTSVQRLTPCTGNQWGKSFYKQKEGAPCRNSTVICNSHLKIGHPWSDQHYLGCFRYS